MWLVPCHSSKISDSQAFCSGKPLPGLRTPAHTPDPLSVSGCCKQNKDNTHYDFPNKVWKPPEITMALVPSSSTLLCLWTVAVIPGNGRASLWWNMMITTVWAAEHSPFCLPWRDAGPGRSAGCLLPAELIGRVTATASQTHAFVSSLLAGDENHQ